MDLVSLVEVGKMHFNGRKRNGLDDVVERHTREAEPGWIDDRAINIIDVRLKGINQDAFVIGLLDDHLDAEFRSERSNLFIDEFKCRQPVNVRLTAPEQIRIRAVQNEKSKPARAIRRPFLSVHTMPCYRQRMNYRNRLTVLLPCHD